MKKKALLTLTAVMLGLFCLTSCQSQEERTISKLEQLSERIEENGDKYDVEDWNGIMKEMESISDDIEDCDLTSQQMKEVGRLQAKFYKAVMKNGKKSYVRTSPMVHAYTAGGTRNYTNAESVTVKKMSVSLKPGKTYKIKASVTKLQKDKKLMPNGHAPTLRYVSSNKKIAMVSKSGKVTAKSKGSCKVYVIAVNGASKTVEVTVK